MNYLRQWNVILLLNLFFLLIITGSAAAQMTPAEKDCIVKAGQETIQHDQAFRSIFNDTVRQVREQHCPPEPGLMTQTESFALVPLLPELLKVMQPKMTACFAADLERLRAAGFGIFMIMNAELEKSLPRPFCP